MHHRLDRRHLLRTCGTLAAGCVFAAPWAAARAAGAPSLRSLQLVVPTPPASQPDMIARWLIEPLALQAGVAGQVVNRPGAAGAIAADAVLAATPESGTLLLGGLDHVAYSHLNSQRRPLDPFVDFVPVASVNRDSWVVVTSAKGAVTSLAGLAERSRQDGGLNYASTGEGSTAHLLSARLVKALGIEAQHVPYRDPWMPDLIAGRVQFVVAPAPAVIGQIRGDRLRALATLTEERLPAFADVPSIRELGRPDQVFHGGLFVFAPANLAPVAPRLNTWLVEVMSQPDIVSRYREASIEPTPLDLAQTADLVRQRLQLIDGMRLAVFGRTR